MIDRFQQRDIPGALNYFAEDVSVHLPPALPYGGSYHGRSGFQDYMGRLHAAWDRFDITVDSTFSSSGTVLVRETLSGSLKGKTETVTMPLILAFEVENNLIARQDVFYWEPEIVPVKS